MPKLSKLDGALQLFKILVGQFQHYLKMQASLHKLPPPTPLPETWDDLLAEPSTPEAGDGDQ